MLINIYDQTAGFNLGEKTLLPAVPAKVCQYVKNAIHFRIPSDFAGLGLPDIMAQFTFYKMP
jgi:hypothetical protein